MTVEYEEMYGRLWKALVKKENERNASAKQRGEDIKEKIMAKSNDTLPSRAKQINRMMCLGMIQSDIAQVMGTSQQSISQTQTRYGLPRPEET